VSRVVSEFPRSDNSWDALSAVEAASSTSDGRLNARGRQDTIDSRHECRGGLTYETLGSPAMRRPLIPRQRCLAIHRVIPARSALEFPEYDIGDNAATQRPQFR